MTVSTNDTIERYEISGAGPYAFSFRIFNDTDLSVLAIHASTGVPATLTYLTHYTVTGANVASGGSITLVTPAQTTYAGYILDIRSNTPQNQLTSIRNQARFLPEIHEEAFDYLSRQIQDLDRRQDAAVRLPDSELPTVDWDTILSIANRKGKYFGYFNLSTGAPELFTSIGATSLSQSVIGALLYPQTAAEIAAGVTPTNYAYPELNVLRYGGDNTGATDSSAAFNTAVTIANNYPPSLSSCKIHAPSGNYRIDNTITMPARENTEMVIDGDIDVRQMTAGDAVFEFVASSYQTLRFHNLEDLGQRVDAIVLRHGVVNQIYFSRITKCRYGITFINEGNGGHSKVENHFHYAVIGECLKGVYFQAPTGTTDACEGAQFWGGFLFGNTEHGVLISAGVNANFGFISGAIDGFTSGSDYENLANTTAGWTLMLKFMQNTAYYTLGRKDSLYNTQITGVTMKGPDNGLYPALLVDQTIPLDLAGAVTGKACALFVSGDAQDGTTEQGVLVANDPSFSATSAVGLQAGYVSQASAAAGGSAFIRAIHRNNADTTVTLGAALYFTRRAGSDVSDATFVDSAGNIIAKFYDERNSVRIPVAKTPASAAATGEQGQIAWDASYVYVCTATNTWKRVAIATW